MGPLIIALLVVLAGLCWLAGGLWQVVAVLLVCVAVAMALEWWRR